MIGHTRNYARLSNATCFGLRKTEIYKKWRMLSSKDARSERFYCNNSSMSPKNFSISTVLLRSGTELNGICLDIIFLYTGEPSLCDLHFQLLAMVIHHVEYMQHIKNI